MATNEPTEDLGTARRSPWTLIVVVLIIAVVVALGGAFVLGGANSAPTTKAASVGLVLEDPSAYSDGTVVLSGRVENLLTERAVTIGSDLVEGDLLVILEEDVIDPTGVTAAIPARVGQTFFEGDVIQVTGDVRTLQTAAFEEDYGLVLNPELFGQYVGEPAFIARDVSLTTLGEPPVIEAESVSLQAIADQPADWVGRLVVTSGSMGERIDDGAFLLEADEFGATSIIIVGTPALLESIGEVSDGAELEVRGTVWELDRQIIEAQTEVELDASVYADLEGRPALLAESVQTVE